MGRKCGICGMQCRSACRKQAAKQSRKRSRSKGKCSKTTPEIQNTNSTTTVTCTTTTTTGQASNNNNTNSSSNNEPSRTKVRKYAAKLPVHGVSIGAVADAARWGYLRSHANNTTTKSST